MKNFFSKLGLAVIICLSFILTERVVTVMNDMDDLMNIIKEKESDYSVSSIDAVIDGDYIVPGLYGKVVNVKKSYDQMKKIGNFNEKYFVYDDVKPNISLDNNMDKIIVSGNKKKKSVALVFIVNSGDNIDEIVKILSNKNVNGTFFVDFQWLNDNMDFCKYLISKNNIIGILENSSSDNYIFMRNMLRSFGQMYDYCYYKGCKNSNSFIIKPSDNKKNLLEIKKTLVSGDIIELDVNDRTNDELSVIIDYIKSRGFELKNVSDHISEKN